MLAQEKYSPCPSCPAPEEGASILFHCLRCPHHHPTTPVTETPQYFCLPHLGASALPPLPTYPWRSPSQHSASLEPRSSDLIPSHSYDSHRASPTWKPGSRPLIPRPPIPSPYMPSTSSPGPQRPLVLMLSGLKPWALALKEGSTTSKWHFSNSQAPNRQSSPQDFCMALILPEPSLIPGTLPLPSPYPVPPTSSPADGL